MPNTPRSLRTIREIRRRDILFSVAQVPDSERLLVGSSEGKVLELDASQNNPEARELANHGRYVTSVRLAGNKVISGGYDGKLIWWDLETNREIRTVDAHSRWIRKINISPDGSKVASVADDMVCRIWEVNSGRRLHELRGHEERTPTHFTSMLYTCAFSDDGRYLATGDRVGHVVVWEVSSGRQRAQFDVPVLYTWDGSRRIRSIGGVRAFAFSPDGTHLAVGGVGQIGNVDAISGPSTVEVFNWANGERAYRFTGPNGMVNRLIYHPNQPWLCALGGRGNGLVMFYDTDRRDMIHRGDLPMHVHDALINDDFSRMYAVGHNRVLVSELRS